jgi:uncharacterized membrane protein
VTNGLDPRGPPRIFIRNTLMAIAAGLALVMIVGLGWRLARGGTVHRQAWAAAFAGLGFILTLLGAHMTLTWPLSGPTAFDSIAFGEPSLALDVILLSARSSSAPIASGVRRPAKSPRAS